MRLERGLSCLRRRPRPRNQHQRRRPRPRAPRLELSIQHFATLCQVALRPRQLSRQRGNCAAVRWGNGGREGGVLGVGQVQRRAGHAGLAESMHWSGLTGEWPEAPSSLAQQSSPPRPNTTTKSVTAEQYSSLSQTFITTLQAHSLTLQVRVLVCPGQQRQLSIPCTQRGQQVLGLSGQGLAGGALLGSLKVQQPSSKADDEILQLSDLMVLRLERGRTGAKRGPFEGSRVTIIG